MNAADVVMQYALNRLEFPPERIIVYGWSIGGFTASWTAMNYPNVRAVILDATFDHVLPLAANVMPVSWKPLVAATIKHQLNLSVADQIVKYPGPIRLFRRSRDEIISLECVVSLSSQCFPLSPSLFSLLSPSHEANYS